MSTSDRPSSKERLLDAGARLMASKGFSGASVREICDAAGTSSNMIHHFFGSKAGLYEAILERFSADVFATPLRVIAGDPDSQEEFASRLTVFAEETLEALIEHRHTFQIVIRDQVHLEVFAGYGQNLVRYLESAKARGFVRPEVDSGMLTGLLMDRLGNQVRFAEWIKREHDVDVVGDTAYRNRWIRANLDVLLNGMLM